MYRKVPTVDRTRKVLPSQAGMNYMYKYNTNTVATVYCIYCTVPTDRYSTQ